MNKKRAIIILSVCWLAFIVWEILFMNWANQQGTAMVRFDLVVILPILILFTIFMLFQIYSKRRKK
ncbi:hypothetical protein [Formosa sp. A9]|uniref:hypothetical protein n=1 Tax=Formosa sp. A9 TaxID=3442641 RepID=UPI003EBCA048